MLQGWFWDRSPTLWPALRRVKRALLLFRHKVRGGARPPYVVTDPPGPGTAAALSHPAIVLYVPEGVSAAAERFLGGQTETSATADPAAAGAAAFCAAFRADLERLPPTWLEAQLLVAVAEGLLWTASDRFAAPGLVRLPSPEVRAEPPVVGRDVPHVGGAAPAAGDRPGPDETLVEAPRSGPYALRHDLRPGSVVRRRLVSVREVLEHLPASPGPRTALFLLPFLAVGGAERLLFELLAGLAGRYRLLVVTLEPHRAELGQTVDDARRLTPYVYTLGDWLPREAHGDVLDHLLRRYRVETLVSWNGTVLFYEAAAELKRRRPGLRLVNQLYNHEGGWIEHYGPRLVESVDLHIAVNRPIGRALSEQRGVADERLAVIPHGVPVPEEPAAAERAERRRRAREELGLPAGAVVAGSFLRLHPQKRPFDILATARRLLDSGERRVHFLIAGGGPLESKIAAELAARPLANLTRLPMRRDVETLYDAVDLCFLPSAFEGLPIFLLDGLARGLPAVATAVGDVPDLLRDGGGSVVERIGDVDALAAAVLGFCDARRRAAEGRRGRAAVARRFGLEPYLAAYEDALFPAAAGERPPE